VLKGERIVFDEDTTVVISAARRAVHGVGGCAPKRRLAREFARMDCKGGEMRGG
jgi:hypothetical protein